MIISLSRHLSKPAENFSAGLGRQLSNPGKLVYSDAEVILKLN
jgi:hypothetical protein